MDAAQEPSTQQGSPLPPEPLRQNSPPAGAPCVACLTNIVCFRSTDGLSCVRSASGAHQEEQGEQGEKAEEEGACCFAGIPVDTLCTLISRFCKAVIIIRWGYAVYQCIVRCIYIYTDTHARPQAMSVVMLPRRKHDVRLRDKHVCMLPCIFTPLSGVNQKAIRFDSCRM
jgi:hypothetical protein